uniref:Metalloendopeptidase n=1 Tax=Lates calcarifer TaxID=8187 RepID=A0A4W6FID1_LATCA
STPAGIFKMISPASCLIATIDELSVSELLWRANKDVGKSFYDEPFVIGDIAYSNETKRNADPCTSYNCKWVKHSDGNVYVPYVIANHYSLQERAIIESGLQSFQRVSCVHFVPRTNQRDYLSIQSGTGCYSYIGRRGSAQVLSLSRQGCISFGTCPQSRSDRDQHIRVLCLIFSLSGYWNQFYIVNTLNLNTPYDYNSVMQYGSTAASWNGLPTMVPIPDPNVQLGEATQMSRNDVIRVNRLYNC